MVKCNWCGTRCAKKEFALVLKDSVHNRYEKKTLYFCHYNCLLHYIAENWVQSP